MTTAPALRPVDRLTQTAPPTSPVRVAQDLMAQVFTDGTGAPLLLRWRESWWSWAADLGLWVNWSDERLDGKIQTALGESEYLHTDQRNGAQAMRQWTPDAVKISRVRLALREQARIDDQIEIGEWLDGRDQAVIQCRGSYLHRGEWDYMRDSHWYANVADPRRFCTSGLNCEPLYDAHHESEEWQTFLDSILDAEGQLLLQEWFGYLASGRTDLQKALQMIGPPRSGKGVTTHVIRKLFGRSAGTSSVQAIGGDFGLQPLLSLSVVAFSDVRIEGRSGTKFLSHLLTIIGEDPVSVNRKGQPEISNVKMPCRFTITANMPVVLPDDSGALDARWLFLRTRQSHVGHEDVGLSARLTTPGVLSAILNWALRGLDRLEANGGRFTVQQDSVEDRELARAIGSPLSEYIGENYLADADGTVSLDEFHTGYVYWLAGLGPNRGQSKASTRRDLRSANYRLSHARLLDSRLWVIVGLSPCAKQD